MCFTQNLPKGWRDHLQPCCISSWILFPLSLTDFFLLFGPYSPAFPLDPVLASLLLSSLVISCSAPGAPPAAQRHFRETLGWQSCNTRTSELSLYFDRWLKRRPTMADVMFTFWMSIAPPAIPQPHASRIFCSIGNSFE